MAAVSVAKAVASGAAFGSALVAAGVYSPTVIIGQMHLTDFHMLKAFVAASASSGIAILLANHFSFSNCQPRTASSINLFSSYDANIVGGLLLGFGMAMTGACPGTVLPQVASSIPSTPLVLLGGVIGGTLWSGFGKGLLVKQASTASGDAKAQTPRTIPQKLGISQVTGVVLFEVMCMGILLAATIYAPTPTATSSTSSSLLPPIAGGILIGISQLTSLVLTSNTLGISSAYEQVGDLILWLLSLGSGKKGSGPPVPRISSTYFALGTVLGSWVLTQVMGLGVGGRTGQGAEPGIGNLRAVVGGAVMLFGSRLAGGCTSGHGISGMSMLSISSFISVAAMFAGGMGLAAIL